ncbi:SDR family NAD(P)-dependent oxidoreductase [Parapedobacter sp. ISTM3]|uniref:SDR family NAD(P)-dependent oxidoreductase n=1 Tax=Parapedobacter sp. ISTM3 TaxID=2800130 RepID=UPI0019034835|nr:SDR family NAD(P)-dependent oxidoreductase [Parapedobacter sp. ISTM3]MBK1438435.1 SDR family NAD(P)-dependent oxidoreductase [Parapedobacter sp. ISTM3]
MRALSEQVVMITGATDGLGKALAKALAWKGTALILHGRNPDKGRSTVDALVQETGNKNIIYYNADMANLGEVRALAAKLLSAHQQLDLLINNAGIGPAGGGGRRQMSQDGYELRFAVNYLAPFLLTDLLLPLLQQTEGSRVVMVASGLQEPLDFEDLMLDAAYTGRRAYGQSKLALVMLAMTLSHRLRDAGIRINSVHPASLMDTTLVRESNSRPRSSISEGVDAVLFVATSPEVADISGAFFDGKRQARAHDQAYDENARKMLFTISSKLAGL